MKLYGPDGELKPLASRPLVWNLFLAYGNEEEAQQPVGGHGGAPEIVGEPANAAQDHFVPGHILGMRYILAQRLEMSAPLMQTLHDVWVTKAPAFPMYAC